MTLPRYPAYRDSGVEWLGEVPAHWEIGKFRHLFAECSEKIDSDVFGEMLSVSGYRGVEIKEYDDENKRRTDDELVGYRVVRAGQLVINTMWMNYGGLGVSRHDGHVSPAYRAYSIFENIDRFYADYLLRSSAYVSGYIKYLKGIRPNSLQMGHDDLQSLWILLPQKTEQIAIAAFLDRETAKIDGLVREQERLVELLAEKRRAVVSHAVTKGLDRHAPMKDSGIDWLGEVPAHWEVMQLKRDLEFLTSGSRGWAEHYADHGALFIRIGNLTRDGIGLDLSDIQRVAVPEGAEGARTRLRTGDVLFSITAYLGSIAVVPEDLEEAYVSQHVALARLRQQRLLPSWVAFVTLSYVGSTYLGTQGYGGTKIQLSLDDVANAIMTCPPLDEQRAIIAHIDRETSKLDALKAEAERAVALLKERRAALISAAVTGKIDVRSRVEEAA